MTMTSRRARGARWLVNQIHEEEDKLVKQNALPVMMNIYEEHKKDSFLV